MAFIQERLLIKKGSHFYFDINFGHIQKKKGQALVFSFEYILLPIVPPEEFADRGTFTHKYCEMTYNVALNKQASVSKKGDSYYWQVK